ncbi:hypothetical protein WN943_027222 [Citrus x changshan-huyou]
MAKQLSAFVLLLLTICWPSPHNHDHRVSEPIRPHMIQNQEHDRFSFLSANINISSSLFYKVHQIFIPFSGEQGQTLKDGPFQVLEWINDNAYKLDLPNEYNASTTFNVSNLSPFDAGDNLRTNPLQEEGDDGIKGKTITSTWDEVYLDPIQVLVGPVTRAQAKKFKEALNGLIQATWAQSNLWRRVKRIAHDKCMIQALEVFK